MERNLLAILAAFVVSSIPISAIAVSSSYVKPGDAAIVPFYSTSNGFGTLISLSNSFPQPVGLKLLVLDETSAVAESMAIYLAGFDTWVAAMWPSEDGSELISQDSSCSSVFGDAGGSLAVPATGQVVVILMGYLQNEAALDANIPVGASVPADCASLLQRWEAGGVWTTSPNADVGPAGNQLTVNAHIVNREDGSLSRIDVLHLQNFSDSVLHFPPEEPRPHLGDANNTQSGKGGAVTSIHVDDGTVLVDDWSDGLDAVNALLTIAETRFAYSAEAAAAGELETILTLPTFQLLQERGDIELTDGWYRYDSWSRQGHTARELQGCRSAINPNPCQMGERFTVPGAVVSLTSAMESRLVVTERLPVDPELLLDAGQLVFSFGLETPEGAASFVAVGEKHAYLGLPVLVSAIQRFRNGFIFDNDGNQVIGNYEASIQLHTRRGWVDAQ